MFILLTKGRIFVNKTFYLAAQIISKFRSYIRRNSSWLEDINY